jgi:hypothetical protein
VNAGPKSDSSAARFAILAARLRTDGPTIALGPLQTIAEGTTIATLRADGREAVLLMPDGTVKSVTFAASGDALAVGATTTLFQAPKTASELSVSPDGQQIVFVESPFAQGQTIRILTHWEARLR